jgi:F-type H+-transporting ATPase subunit epsilon
MATFHFELVSPERLVHEGQVEQVVVPGAEGEFGVLAGHAPYVATLKPGVLSVIEGASTKKLFVRGGFAEVGPGGLTVLAETAVPLEQLSAEKIAAEIKAAKEDVADAKDDATRQRAQERVEQLEAVAAIVK